jgi:2-C-methyl-D-erythritol 4-phosphate cytidylyltransferase
MHTPRIWAVVPAAGIGRRMGSQIPKQYLKALDYTVIEYTLRKLAAVPQVTEIIVSISENDHWWQALNLDFKKTVRTVVGGDERIHSVLNAVESIEQDLTSQDWIMVHDAARPCVSLLDIQKLIAAVESHPCGGILATPIHDTVKRASVESDSIDATVERNRLWRALTPQLFRAPLLLKGLRAGIRRVNEITDEASAMELLGYHPQLIEGRSSNIKITQTEDLQLAEFYLGQEAHTLGF